MLKSTKIWTIICVILYFNHGTLTKTCENGQVLHLNDKYEEECIPCGENCSTCFLMENQQPKCFFCKEGYYLDKADGDQCKACSTGCARCIGPELGQCSSAQPGYFYDGDSNSIMKCDDSCHRCHSATSCAVCSEGYYSKRDEKVEVKESEKKDENQSNGDGKDSDTDSKSSDTNKEESADSKSSDKKPKPDDLFASKVENSLLDFGEDFLNLKFRENDVKCINCDIENCLYCSEKQDQVKQNKFVTCSLCKPEFGLVDGRCQACPPNCRYCKEQTGECTSCQKGYQWDSESHTCKSIELENCTAQRKGECIVCDNFFYLDKTSKTCLPCSKEIANCTHCRKVGSALKCQFCERGYYLPNNSSMNNFLIALKNMKEGKPLDAGTEEKKPDRCIKCSENCNHCDSERCYICKKGYYYNKKKKKCLRCKIENCDQCFSFKKCAVCRAGFYFDKESGECTSCPKNCLKCSSAKHCHSCPINYFILMKETVTHSQTPNILGSILGMFFGSVGAKLPPVEMTQVEIKSDCVEKCPEEIDGQKVTVNLAERKCVVREKGGEEKVIFPPVGLPQQGPSDSIYHDVMQLKLHYDEQIEHIKKVGLAMKGNQGSSVSSECYNHGLIRKVFRGNLSSYFICRCQPGFLGDNCQISKELHSEVQSKLMDRLNQLQKDLPSMSKSDMKEILSTLILFNKFKIEEPIISKIVNIMGYLQDQEASIDNKKKLYVLYDSQILSVFDLMEDLRKHKSRDRMGNIDDQRRLDKFHGLITQLVGMIETSFQHMDYSHSFLKAQKDEYVGLDTFSYVIAEFPLGRTEFQISNPNIDTSFNIDDSTVISLISAEKDGHLNSRYNIQLISYSMTLFNYHFPRYELLSNPVYLKFIDPHNPHVSVGSTQALVGKIKVTFPLLYLPGYDQLEKHLYCRGFSSGSFEDGAMLEGEVVRFDEDSQSVLCEFTTKKKGLGDMYFSVFKLKRDSLE